MVIGQLAETKKICAAHEKKSEVESYWLTDIATQHKFMQKKTGEVLSYDSSEVFKLDIPSKKV